MINNVDSKSPSFHEKSIFHTHKPRDTKTKVHLLLVLISFATSFVMAIVFAETGGSVFRNGAHNKPLKEAHNHSYGKSE